MANIRIEKWKIDYIFENYTRMSISYMAKTLKISTPTVKKYLKVAIEYTPIK